MGKPDVVKNLGLARRYASKYVASHVRKRRDGVLDTDEYQDACLGLLEAAEKYDPTRGTQFSTCAFLYMRKQVNIGQTGNSNRYVHKRFPEIPQIPISVVLGDASRRKDNPYGQETELEASIMADRNTPPPDHGAIENERKSDSYAVKTLAHWLLSQISFGTCGQAKKERNIQVLLDYLELGTLAAVAEKHGLAVERTRQIRNSVLDKLRDLCKRKSISWERVQEMM